MILFKEYKVDDDEEYINAEDAASHLFADSSKAAVRLRGFRHRDGLTQSDLAKKMKTTQSVIASLESAKRPISYKMAQKLAILICHLLIGWAKTACFGTCRLATKKLCNNTSVPSISVMEFKNE